MPAQYSKAVGLNSHFRTLRKVKKTDKETKKKAMFFCFRHERYNYMQF